MLSVLPPPPRHTWIVVEHEDDDRVRLRWLPLPEWRVNWGRWRALVGIVYTLGGWAVGAMILGVIWLLTLTAAVQNPVEDWTEWLVLAFLSGFVGFVGLVVLGLVAGFWGLLTPFRPEGLILTPEALSYDPGHYYFAECASSGKPQEVPRPRPGAIKLERVEGRLRLTIDHGVDRFEVGGCLREPEKEWLAEALRSWAGAPPGPAGDGPAFGRSEVGYSPDEETARR